MRPDPGVAAPFDRRQVRLHRDRAAHRAERIVDLSTHFADLLLDRLDDVKRRFGRALEIGGRGVVAPRLRTRGVDVVSCDLSLAMLRHSPGTGLVADEECLPFAPASFDLIVANGVLHWTNDLPGALIQMRRVLRPDGLLLASLPISGSLDELRAALPAAEEELTGGVSPRLSPLADLRDLAGLLQRAGFAHPVADRETIRLAYGEPSRLLFDLRDAGETNATRARNPKFASRLLFPLAFSRLAKEENRVFVTLQLAILTAWSPGDASPGAGDFASIPLFFRYIFKDRNTMIGRTA